MALKRYALCLTNDSGPDFDGGDVLPGLVYEALGEERSMLRVIDESGEDYLFPASLFAPIALRGRIRQAVLAAV